MEKRSIDSYSAATQVYFHTARESLLKMDIQQLCQRTGAQYNQDSNQYEIVYLGAVARVDGTDCSMEWEFPIDALSHIILLHYFMCADGRKPKGELIGLHQVAPIGSTRVQHMKKASIQPLIEVFGEDMDAFFHSATLLGGEQISDSSIRLFLLPHIPIQITIWPKDDEFPCDARILFDRTLHGQLYGEDLVYVADVAVQALIRVSGKPYTFHSVW